MIRRIALPLIAGWFSVGLLVAIALWLGDGNGGAKVSNGFKDLGSIVGGGMVAGIGLVGIVACMVTAIVAAKRMGGDVAVAESADAEQLRQANATIVFLSDQVAERDRTIASLRRASPK